MKVSWRWFGPEDPMLLSRVGQAGAVTLETSLAHLPVGAAWTDEDIRTRRKMVEAHPNAEYETLRWEALGGIPIHNDIKLGRAEAGAHIRVMAENLRRLCGQGVRRILINVMPLIDWARTDLQRELPTGAFSVAYDALDVAAFDLFMIKRPNAADGYEPELIDTARARYEAMSESRRRELTAMLIEGLPGGDSRQDQSEFLILLSAFNAITKTEYQRNIFDLIGEICRVLEQEGGLLAVHPDDPPWPICGLPRMMSSLTDYEALFEAVPSPANGILFCSGALGASPMNDLPTIARALSGRIHYAHLRAVRHLSHHGAAGWSFCESEHLGEDADLFALAQILVEEEHARRATGETGLRCDIPYRADHGQHILADLDDGPVNPGYAPVGMTKATAELRGMIHAIERFRAQGAA